MSDSRPRLAIRSPGLRPYRPIHAHECGDLGWSALHICGAKTQCAFQDSAQGKVCLLEILSDRHGFATLLKRTLGPVGLAPPSIVNNAESRPSASHIIVRVLVLDADRRGVVWDATRLQAVSCPRRSGFDSLAAYKVDEAI